ncbi:MAG: hypothetical protein AB7O45_03620 [Alphaproteobacteria bacterium]
MIIQLTTAGNRGTMTQIVDGPARAAGIEIRTMTYGDLLERPIDDLPRAAWLFTDIDLLDPTHAFRSAKRAAALAARGDRLVNHPTRSMGRYELLRTLHARGVNDFDVYRATDPRRPGRYPVFVRWINSHSGPISGLLHDPAALEDYLARCLEQGRPRDVLMAVEFCDVREQTGLVREYGAHRVGDTILPEHLWFSESWMVKQRTAWNMDPAGVDLQSLYREEWRYLEDNPHAAELRRIFDLARIDFGRIDYGLRDGRIQVWEINTNPLVTVDWTIAPDRDPRPLSDWFVPRFLDALRSIDVA